MNTDTLKSQPPLGISGDSGSQIGFNSSLQNDVSLGAFRPRPIHTSTLEDVEWRYMQSFGDDGTSDDDLVTALAYDPTGNYVAVGDKAGRICLFEAASSTGTYRDAVSQCLEKDPTIVYPNKLLSHRRRIMLGENIPESTEDQESVTAYSKRVRPLKWIANYPIGSRHSPAVHYALSRGQIPEGYDGKSNGKSQNRLSQILHENREDLEHLLPEQRPEALAELDSDAMVDDSVDPDGTRAEDTRMHMDDDRTAPSVHTLPWQLEYRFYSEYQAHENEFDALKSTDIEPRVTSLCWSHHTPSTQHLLSANDKSLKLWTLRERVVRTRMQGGVGALGEHVTPSDYSLPSTAALHAVTVAQCKQSYRGAHTYHVHSVAACADMATFVSADDLSVNMWHYEHPDQSFALVNMRPAVLEEITEVATRVTTHPDHASLLALATSRGCIRLLDMRTRSTCDAYARCFERSEEPLHKSFFSEVVHCASDAKFAKDGRHLVSRDYFNIYVWDLAMEHRPVATIPVHDYLRSHTCDLYENDCLFDQFRVAVSPDGQQVVSGSYHNHFVIHNLTTGVTSTHEAGARPPRRSTKGKLKRRAQQVETPNIAFMDFSRRALHVAWHPQLDVLAIAGVNKLYVYHAHAAEDNSV